jgi:ribokinase
MPATPNIVVLGSINTDLVVRGARLPAAGETVVGGEFFQAAGGKGANQAVAAARAGIGKVTFIGAIGNDALGEQSVVGLERDGIDRRWIKVVPDRPSGVALILVDHGGENLISVAGGANDALTAADVAAVPDEVFANAKVFLTCLESPLPAVVAGIRRARAAGLTTILNPAPANLAIVAEGVLPLVDVLTPNRSEAGHLTGFDTSSREGLLAAAMALKERGCKNVIVTLGAEGALVAGDAIDELAAIPVTAIDATAAGDAFNGALAVGVAEGRSLLDAARWASAAAAISVTRLGAQPSLPRREEIDLLAGRGRRKDSPPTDR